MILLLIIIMIIIITHLEPLRQGLHCRVVRGREGVLRHDHGHGIDLL